MEFFNSIQQVKSNWQPYKKWEAEQDNKEFQRAELNKRVHTSKEDLEQASQYGRTLIDSINIMDQYSINKAEDVELTSQTALSIVAMGLSFVGLGGAAVASKLPSVKKYLAKSAGNSLKTTMVQIVPVIALPLMILPFFIVKFASYEKEASRIARYQAREDELKDPKNFVIYDNNQLNEAKKKASLLPNIEEKKKNKLNPIANYGDSIKSIKKLMSDHENYLKWKQEHLKNEKIKTDSFDNLCVSPEQLQKAKKDQDNLLRAIKKIEINSQSYLANTEMACNTILGSDLVIGALGGGIISGATWLLQKMKIVSKGSKFANITKMLAPVIAPVLLVVVTSTYATKIQKDAARIGRFKAKQELLKDPHNFITYSDEELNSIKDLKAPTKPQKGFFTKTKEDIKFFFQLIKDYKEWNEYKKTDYVSEQKLQKALKEVSVSEKQMKDAKALQKNAFMSFEKIDEMTQRYVDDTEGATDIAKQYISSASSLLSVLAYFSLMAKTPAGGQKIQDTIIKSLPLLAPLLVQIPTEIKITQIKKEAGKIGIMKAMQDLEDPKHFVNTDSTEKY